ncbi:related to permeases of the major facilitator superfamily [Phialocephala subalpina]|uniref:Related to permeases of the major facilitator superfamily n=1 Tax=Phialocephala subalpina TaxID=576137 RepID=A0A1L7WUC9_9HELO|nr:related to permeases of the major facilitator superfamily [Phialocephala subalpina]
MSTSIATVLGDNNRFNGASIASIPKESPDVTVLDEETLDLKDNLQSDPDARESFLAEFSAKESKAILNKVDRRFFILIGLMFLIKNMDSGKLASFSFGDMAEAGMFPGVITHLAYWYRTGEFSRPMVWFFAISNLAGIVGSLLCYGISYMNGLQGLSAWRWVFLIEGILTIILSGFIFWILPDLPKSPRSKSWLTEREQKFIETRLPLNAPVTGDKNFDWKEAWHAFRSPSVYGFMLCQTFMNLALAAFNWYLPTIITNFGFVGLPRNQLLNIPPIGAGILGIIFSSWFQSRGFVVRPAYINSMVLGNVIFLVVLAYAPGSKAKYVACIFTNLFSASFYPPYWSWRAGYLSGATGAAFAIGLQSAVSNIGSVVSPQFFQSKWAYDGYRNSWIICIVLVVCAQLANLYTWRLTRKVERQVLRVRREVLRAKKAGREYNGRDDVDALGDDNIKNRRLW